jgi:hypothetical protein
MSKGKMAPPSGDKEAWMGAKKKAVGDIAKWAGAGIGDQLRKKYASKAAAECPDCGMTDCVCGDEHKRSPVLFNK